ncbi:MAG TPA: hypothetical protein VN922_05040 [Bacteroidia bacterium]|nr:hypothetical protein [Bacteroidia bacterium]
MKKLLTAIILLLSISFTKAQITLEHTYPNGGNLSGWQDLRIVHFSSHGYKYAITRTPSPSGGTITLYNLNHTLYKTINIPKQKSLGAFQVYYISDSLFNTNPSDIEYLVSYEDTNYIRNIKVYNDAGNILLAKDSVNINYPNELPYTERIFYTPNGYKMILPIDVNSSNPNADTMSYVYSLPGALPCNECSNGVLISGMQPMGGNGNNGYLSNPYPNPSSHSTTIKYQLPDGENNGQLIFYDL